MKKLIRGIVDFRKNIQKDYRDAFGRLATGQAPDSLFIACSDSRVVPNTFASTNPGDLFVIRNVGNLIPPYEKEDLDNSHNSEGAAIDFSVQNLKVANIIVCGHSECGAMIAIAEGRRKADSLILSNWLKHGNSALELLNSGIVLDSTLSKHNQLSQLNVLEQMKHLQSYPSVLQRLRDQSIAIHGWWFDIAHADVYSFDPKRNKFVLIDEHESERLLADLDR